MAGQSIRNAMSATTNVQRNEPKATCKQPFEAKQPVQPEKAKVLATLKKDRHRTNNTGETINSFN